MLYKVRNAIFDTSEDLEFWQEILPESLHSFQISHFLFPFFLKHYWIPLKVNCGAKFTLCFYFH